MTVSFATQFADTRSATSQDDSPTPCNCNPAPQHEVGRVAQGISDDELDAGVDFFAVQGARDRERMEVAR